MTEQPVIELRRYPSRKLYNKSESRYVRLPEIADLIRNGASIRVEDTETGEDVTRQVLLQIIMEQETQPDHSVLSVDLMTEMIRLSSSRTSQLMRGLFDQSAAFMRAQQERFASQVTGAMAQPWAVFDPQQLQELQKDYQQRLAAFWSGTVTVPPAGQPRGGGQAEAPQAPGADAEELRLLRERLERLEKKLSGS